MKRIIIFSWLVIFLSGCWNVEDNIPHNEGEFEGVRPVYISSEGWNVIDNKPPLEIGQLGKIYAYGHYLFVNEKNKGIHVINNQDAANPSFVTFISIPGNKDIAIKGQYLYVDNITDLVTLDISDFNDVKEVSRMTNIYPQASLEYPELYSGFFECVDHSKGLVVGWESAVLTNPECWR